MFTKFILLTVFLLLSFPSLVLSASGNCPSLFQELLKKDASFTYYKNGTSIKIIYAMYAEGLIQEGEFTLLMKNGSEVKITKPLDALSALYNIKPEDIKKISFHRAHERIKFTKPQDMVEYFFKSSRDYQYKAFLAELNNHLHNSFKVAIELIHFLR